MKKLVVVVLAIIIALSLCACGKKDADTNGGLLSSQPRRKDKKDIETYVTILNTLEGYLEDGEITIYDPELKEDVKGSQALEYCYQTIQGLKRIDKWIGTEYLPDTRTRKEILDSFVVIRDVKLHDKAVLLDDSGKVKCEYGSGSYTYNANGQLVKGYMSILDQYFLDGTYDISLGFALRKYFSYNLEYTCSYGQTGDIGVAENKANRITLYYVDERVTSVDCLDAEFSKNTVYSMSYDKQDRLYKAEGIIYEKGIEKTVDTYNFIYDDNNILIREEYVRAFYEGDKTPLTIEGWNIDYKYDSNGKLSSAILSYDRGGELRLTVDYNKDSKLATYHFKHIDENGEVKGIEQKETTYGDLYLSYNPKK